MNVGLLTGGGDCPGLNAVIRAVVRRICNAGGSCLGILEGWRGLVRNLTTSLSIEQTDGIIGQGGTILGASPDQPLQEPGNRPGCPPRELRAAWPGRPGGDRR